ncbi:hypothetical protein HanRHA438_Chr10g0468661 [Helianthus annuus]|nr:hypothetical protein HanRHA438_Chr10g0468661 [Helianthus annuus]
MLHIRLVSSKFLSHALNLRSFLRSPCMWIKFPKLSTDMIIYTCDTYIIFAFRQLKLPHYRILFSDSQIYDTREIDS